MISSGYEPLSGTPCITGSCYWGAAAHLCTSTLTVAAFPTGNAGCQPLIEGCKHTVMHKTHTHFMAINKKINRRRCELPSTESRGCSLN